MRILICYGTTEGQTRKIAEFVADIVRAKDHEPVVVDTSEANSPEPPTRCEAAILAGSVHMGRYQAALVHYVKQWHETLNAMPTVFLSVSLSAASDDPHEQSEIDEIAQKMLHETEWHPTATLHVAGAFRFTRYDFFKRWAMRLIAYQKNQTVDTHSDKEYTDWAALRAFCEAFLAGLPAGRTT